MAHAMFAVEELKFSAFNAFPTESNASNLNELNRLSHHLTYSELLFERQVVDKARRETYEHDHVTWFRLLVFNTHFDTHMVPGGGETPPPHFLEDRSEARNKIHGSGL